MTYPLGVEYRGDQKFAAAGERFDTFIEAAWLAERHHRYCNYQPPVVHGSIEQFIEALAEQQLPPPDRKYPAIGFVAIVAAWVPVLVGCALWRAWR